MWSIPEPAPSSPFRDSEGEAYQPLWRPGVAIAVVVGAGWSTFPVTLPGRAEPAAFEAEHERTKVPSAWNVSSTQPVFVVAAPPSVTCQASATSFVYQPPAPVGVAGSSV